MLMVARIKLVLLDEVYDVRTLDYENAFLSHAAVHPSPELMQIIGVGEDIRSRDHLGPSEPTHHNFGRRSGPVAAECRNPCPVGFGSQVHGRINPDHFHADVSELG